MNTFSQFLRLNTDTEFIRVAKLDNVECITLKPRGDMADDFTKLTRYCNKRGIELYIVREEAGMVHYHGLLAWPSWDTYKKFQQWYNKTYGFIHRSKKGRDIFNEVDCRGWYDYCHKQIVEDPV
jgi:hypothetical protein